jgi:hypothetical protein
MKNKERYLQLRDPLKSSKILLLLTDNYDTVYKRAYYFQEGNKNDYGS